MKIAFVYDAVYPWVKGGAEKRIYEVGKRLVEQGNEVHLFGVRWWDGANTIERDGMMLHGVCGPMDLYVNGRRSISEAVMFSIKLFFPLLRERFDVVDADAFPYFSCFSVKLVSLLRRTPMVITWHEVWGNYWYEYLGTLGFFGKLVEKMVSKLTLRSIAVSVMTKKNLMALGVREHDITIIPNGIDLKQIAGIVPSKDTCDIIFAGRLIKEKNIAMLIEAVSCNKKEINDIACWLIGNGPERGNLLRLASASGVRENVRFFGFMEYNDVIAHIKSSKVFALPSIREGFGMVVIEAFACGVPVITVKSPMNMASLLVKDDSGIVVNPNTIELSRAISTVVKDGNLRKKMATSAMVTAQRFDWDVIVRELAQQYRELF